MWFATEQRGETQFDMLLIRTHFMQLPESRCYFTISHTSSWRRSSSSLNVNEKGLRAGKILGRHRCDFQVVSRVDSMLLHIPDHGRNEVTIEKHKYDGRQNHILGIINVGEIDIMLTGPNIAEMFLLEGGRLRLTICHSGVCVSHFNAFIVISIT